MREIKFRGRDDAQIWHYGDLVTMTLGRPFIIEDMIVDCEISEPITLDPATVGQFTGLKDSTGKEIYEGDIVRFELPPMVLTNEKIAVGAVVYEYGQFLVIIHAMRFTIFGVVNDCTVIGNVYDNPKMLEATE